MLDENGTRYHLLLGPDDWGFAGEALSSPVVEPDADLEQTRPCERLQWDDERGVLTLRSRLHRFVSGSGDRAPSLDARRGAARDRFGNWYWIDEARSAVRVANAGVRGSALFWPQPQPSVTAARGAFGPKLAEKNAVLRLDALCIDDQHHLLIAGQREGQSLIWVLDLFGGGDPFELIWPSGIALDAWDMAAAHGGGVWLLDRARRRYFRLDAQLRVVARDAASEGATGLFEPSAPSSAELAPLSSRQITERDAFVQAGREPVAIESVSEDIVAVLDRGPEAGPSEVLVLRHTRSLLGRMENTVIARLSLLAFRDKLTAADPERECAAFPLTAHDLTIIPESQGRDTRTFLVLLVAATGNQVLSARLSLQADDAKLVALSLYFPMRLFSGRALVHAGGQAFYDSSERWIALVEQRRPRFEAEGKLVTRAFDSRVPGCTWHRVVLEGCFPSGSMVSVSTRAADEQDELAHTQWQSEPALKYRRTRGSELLRSESESAREESWELLLQRARGRYVQLKLTLSGDGVRSPTLRALRIWYPRFSYRDQYLPAFYRDQDLTGFLDRFLANFEGTLTGLEGQVANAQRLLDVQSVPARHLAWLASWFGLLLDPAWDESRQRLFLRHVLQFLAQRGTIRGLRTAVALAVTECVDERLFGDDGADAYGPFGVRIVEHFRSREYPLLALTEPDAGAASGGALLLRASGTARWRAADGLSALLTEYGAFLARVRAGLPIDAPVDPEGTAPATAFPTRAPNDETAEAWRMFVRTRLGMADLANGLDEGGFQRYLARRYRTVAALNAAHGSKLASFSELVYPNPLPENSRLLEDWQRYESIVRPTSRTAHRFTVQVPVPAGGAASQADLQRRLALAKRIVELEKPSHVVFDVQLYWAMFRVGFARLGHDTLIHLGSRAPELLTAAILGRAYLAQSYAGWGPHAETTDRLIAGNDVLGFVESATGKRVS